MLWIISILFVLVMVSVLMFFLGFLSEEHFWLTGTGAIMLLIFGPLSVIVVATFFVHNFLGQLL